jgi:uncharacterized protein (DUF2235 family)
MAKKLIVCCDGTWNTRGTANQTNVSKIHDAVAPQTAAGVVQIPKYFAGVGTSALDHWRGGAFGLGLSRHVMEACRFLVENYEPGDEVYLFGFSRGAFTARSLAGLIRNSGILRRENVGLIKEAYALYRNREEAPNSNKSKRFRETYSHETGIHFIGVWDTVGSLGIPVAGPGWLGKLINKRWAFHDTELSSHVKGAFHALAIDEQRAPFAPALWHQQRDSQGRAPSGQELKQVWFAGVHCDIGGGYPQTALSDLSLLWMVRQAQQYGLEFNRDGFAGAAPNSMGTMHDSRTGAWLLSPPMRRPVGQAANAREYLTNTAQERMDKVPAYNPPDLRGLSKDQVTLEAVPLTVADVLPVVA